MQYSVFYACLFFRMCLLLYGWALQSEFVFCDNLLSVYIVKGHTIQKIYFHHTFILHNSK